MSVPAGDDAKLLRFLSTTALASELSESARRKIAERMDLLFIPAGTVVIRQGDPADALFVVMNGHLRVSVQRDKGETTIAEVGRGELIGEMALLTNDTRSATVTTTRDSYLLRLPKRDFLSLVQQRPGVLLGISRLVIKRLQHAVHGETRPSFPRSLAVAPIGGVQDASEFAAQLAQAMGRHGSVITVNREMVHGHRRFADAMTSVGERLVLDPRRVKQLKSGEPVEEEAPDSVVDAEITQWLHNIESAHDFIVYVCEAELTPWTQRCLRQADRVLLLASPTGNSVPGEVERTINESHGGQLDFRDRELVLLYESGRGGVESPRGTARWLSHRPQCRHHHVRLGRATDLQRLCRALLGRSVGLVLGGGGARGCAHIGVIRALEEVGIPIDAIGGTSVGAIMGAGPALGWDWQGLRDGVKSALIDPGPPIDYTIPITALNHGKKATEQIRKTFGSSLIEDLWIPYFCVSSNLTRGAVHIHRAGPLWQAIRSSVALPGILPPMPSPEGDVLVDGAIMNNLPVDVMRTFSLGGRILAVNVRPEEHMSAGELPDDGILSGWSLLGRTLNAFGTRPNVPRIGEVLLRMTETGNVLSTEEHEQIAELTFNPPVAGVGLMEFSASDRLLEIGYRHAMERLEGRVSNIV